MNKGMILLKDFDFGDQFEDLFNDIPNFEILNSDVDNHSIFVDNDYNKHQLYEVSQENLEIIDDQMNSI